jgi:hypothetical protein
LYRNSLADATAGAGDHGNLTTFSVTNLRVNANWFVTQ